MSDLANENQGERERRKERKKERKKKKMESMSRKRRKNAVIDLSYNCFFSANLLTV